MQRLIFTLIVLLSVGTLIAEAQELEFQNKTIADYKHEYRIEKTPTTYDKIKRLYDHYIVASTEISLAGKVVSTTTSTEDVNITIKELSANTDFILKIAPVTIVNAETTLHSYNSANTIVNSTFTSDANGEYTLFYPKHCDKYCLVMVRKKHDSI